MNGPASTNEVLSALAVGSRGRVLGYTEETVYSAQLQRLGLTPGTEFQVVRKAPLGNPVELRVRGYSLALRPEEASEMLIQTLT